MEKDKKNLNDDELEEVAGGSSKIYLFAHFVCHNCFQAIDAGVPADQGVDGAARCYNCGSYDTEFVRWIIR